MSMDENSLVQGAADTAARLRALEEGRRENALLAHSAANAVVDMKEDLNDFKNDLNELKTLIRTAIGEASEAARQGRITNGRVNVVESWIKEHEKEIEPIVRRAQTAFIELERVAGIADAAQLRFKESNIVQRFIREAAQNGWKAVLTFAGGILLGAQLWEQIK